MGTWLFTKGVLYKEQGCIICSILISGMGAHGISKEHVENMEMFSMFSKLGAL